MRFDTYNDGTLVERLDDQTALRTTYNPDGTVATSRALTAAEQAAFTAAAAANALDQNAATLRSRAGAAIATNNTYVNIASPTTAQAVTQVKVLTRECTAVIRLLLNQLDDITGT